MPQHLGELERLAETSGGIFRTADLTALGITPYQVRKLVSENVIERIKPGYYCLFAAQESMSEAALILRLFPDGVLCMNSALSYYCYSSSTPLERNIAVDKNTSKSRFKLDYPYVQPFYIQPKLLSFGVIEVEYEDSKFRRSS